MVLFLEKILPNVMPKIDELGLAIIQTVTMLTVSGSISFVLGLLLAILLTTTGPHGIRPQSMLYNTLNRVIDFFRSVPFIILITALIPLTRFLSGTAIGTKGAIFPLVVGSMPFFTRQIESALAEVDGGLIEAAISMGSSHGDIIMRVYLKESIPGLVRATTITLVSLVGLTAMAGAVGAGGLGDFAIRYGHQRNQLDATYITVILLLILVSLIQGLGHIIIKRTSH